MMAGIAPPIFSLWRKRAVHGPKDTPGGGFRFPPPGPPLETTQRKGLRPLPLETIPEDRGSGSGKKSRVCRFCTLILAAVRRVLSAIRYSRAVPAPNASTEIFRRKSLSTTKSDFLLDRARPVFFFKKKENGGCIARLHWGDNLELGEKLHV